MNNRIWDDPEVIALAKASDWEGLIDLCSGSNHSDYNHMWSLAMRAHFGPIGTHASRLNERGTPKAEQCRDCPQIFDAMHRAQWDILKWLGLIQDC